MFGRQERKESKEGTESKLISLSTQFQADRKRYQQPGKTIAHPLSKFDYYTKVESHQLQAGGLRVRYHDAITRNVVTDYTKLPSLLTRAGAEAVAKEFAPGVAGQTLLVQLQKGLSKPKNNGQHLLVRDITYDKKSNCLNVYAYQIDYAYYSSMMLQKLPEAYTQLNQQCFRIGIICGIVTTDNRIMLLQRADGFKLFHSVAGTIQPGTKGQLPTPLAATWSELREEIMVVAPKKQEPGVAPSQDTKRRFNVTAGPELFSLQFRANPVGQALTGMPFNFNLNYAEFLSVVKVDKSASELQAIIQAKAEAKENGSSEHTKNSMALPLAPEALLAILKNENGVDGKPLTKNNGVPHGQPHFMSLAVTAAMARCSKQQAQALSEAFAKRYPNTRLVSKTSAEAKQGGQVATAAPVVRLSASSSATNTTPSLQDTQVKASAQETQAKVNKPKQG